MNLSRRLLAGVALALAGLQPAAAQGIEDQTAHERFACLQREHKLEPLADKTPEARHTGLLRLKLRFVAADQPPQIEVLLNRVDPDMALLAKRYVEGYRLPCLHAKDHPIEAVQEFSFHRWGTEPPVQWLAKETSLAGRIQTPSSADLGDSRYFEPGKALVEFQFVEGRDEPDVRFIFSGFNTAFQRDIERHVRRYRLDASVARPLKGRQAFAMKGSDTGATKFRLTKDDFTLVEFLRMVGNVREQPVDLDLDSMSCPFAVRLNLRQPFESNRVFQLETHNPNRAYLVNWLSQLQLRFSSEAQKKDLYGSDLRIQIPCGRLNLSAAPPAS